ncbi:lipopolysaccharide biosynthesis protein [Aliiglaciecola aliphaticivorans]
MSGSTATSRIFSASIANWVGIVLSLLTQIVFVPVYLSHWSAETYGVWLLLITFIGFAGLMQGAHRDFIYHESLKLGRQHIDKVVLQLFSALPIVGLTSLIVFFVVYLQFQFSIVDSSFGLNPESKQDFLLSAMILAFVLLISGHYYGFLLGPVILLGYYPFITWMKVGIAFFTSTIPVFIVVFGGELIDAVIGLAVTTFFVNLIASYLVLNIYKKENLKFSKPNLKLGLKQFTNSTWMLAKHTSDMFRQVGIRFLILPFVGAAAVAQFATNRTVANVAQQSMASLTGPILPELMRYIHEKKQLETQASLALLWLMLCFVIAPGFIVLQLFVEPLFEIWTAGAIEFHPMLFSTLSSSILIMVLAQPAESILRGNNLYKVQLAISLIALAGLILTIYIFSQTFGVLSAGIGLLVAETMVMSLSVWKAHNWMTSKQLNWPWQYFLLSFLSVGLTVISLLLIAYELVATISVAFILLLQFTIAIKFWQLMPPLAKEKVYKILNKLGIRK